LNRQEKNLTSADLQLMNGLPMLPVCPLIVMPANLQLSAESEGMLEPHVSFKNFGGLFSPVRNRCFAHR
jgi:hypothetical protein